MKYIKYFSAAVGAALAVAALGGLLEPWSRRSRLN